MLIKHQALALAVAALLAGCGGGESTEAPHAAAASALRMRALSVPQATTNTVAPEVAAEQLMNYGESALPQYFPNHPTTQTFGPFRYRAYSNGVLLGVVVTAGDPTYKPVNSVWVMGGTFGDQPVPVGMVTDYITPTDPNTGGPGPTGTSNGCFDLTAFDTQGTHLVLTYDITGAALGTHTVDLLVGGMVPFEGQSLRELITSTTGTDIADGASVAVNATFKSYGKRTGDAEVTQYGSVGTVQGTYASFAVTFNSKIVNNPPWVDKQYSLPVGGSYTVTETATTTTTMTGVPGLPSTPQTSTSTTTTTVKYVGQEPITVPAGTYNACKYESSVSGVTTTEWFMVGKGIPLQTNVGGSTGVTVSKATSITLNGQKL